MKTARVVFWLGLVVMFGELFANLYGIFRMAQAHQIVLNLGYAVSSLLSSLYQGGLLIGVAKIIERLHAKGD